MKELTIKEFLYTQPGPREASETDKEFLDISNELLELWDESKLLSEVSDDLRHVVVLGVMGYFLDILCDSGLWRCFSDECKRKYGKRVPFFKEDSEYVEYELNQIDLQFVVWYQLAFNSMQFRFRCPADMEIVDLANLFFRCLEKIYDDLRCPEEYKVFFDIELNDSQYSEKALTFVHWLFWRSWLIFPPFQLTYSQLYSELVELRNSAKDGEAALKRTEQFQHQIMSSFPTGPLAYTLREWLALLLDGKHPKDRQPKFVAPEGSADEALTEHPLYTAFMNANDGKALRFIATYHELNSFFIEGLGWKSGEDHLPAMKGHSDFIIMGTPHGGIMVAKNIAKCVCHPDNPLYDKGYARIHAFNLISQRAVCPGDMLRYLCGNGWVPDMTFPEYPSINGENLSEELRRELALDNWDFIARSYLEEFYTGD